MDNFDIEPEGKELVLTTREKEAYNSWYKNLVKVDLEDPEIISDQSEEF